MIGRSFIRSKPVEAEEETRGFDAFQLRLGDLMRGERATMGKSLLDVQRELKIKAAYIAAIENCDPSAFDTPGFIAGYVRSYARYLGMDPDWAFETFCEESGFATAHGMSAAASGAKPSREERLANRSHETDIFASPATPFVPGRDGVLSRIEPGAIGSILVLAALIGGLGYGAYSVLQEVQRVQFAPVEETPTVVTTLNTDPLAGNGAVSRSAQAPVLDAPVYVPPSPEPVARLHRPEALDLPVMTSRDAPIASLDPARIGTLAPGARDVPVDDTVAAGIDPRLGAGPPGPRVTAEPRPGVQLVAVRPAWVRVRAADGSVIYETIMEPGDSFDVPQTEDPATLRIGESGAVYFAINGETYGPVGPKGQVTSNVALAAEELQQNFATADIPADRDLCGLVTSGEFQVANLSPTLTCQ